MLSQFFRALVKRLPKIGLQIFVKKLVGSIFHKFLRNFTHMYSNLGRGWQEAWEYAIILKGIKGTL
jgi:hypothetical protein